MTQTTGGDQSDVFAFLQDPRTHGLGQPVTRIDTHGAAVFLAGPDVYKVKRAVRFPFMDFSTLEKRHAACEAEIAVNQTNAPGLYLGVVPITLDGGDISAMVSFTPGRTLPISTRSRWRTAYGPCQSG